MTPPAAAPLARPLPLRVAFTRRRDGSVVLRCTRGDGTATWQRVEGRQAAFFPFHDLRHFAVESTLGVQRGFFGLIAAGWDIEDTTGKGKRGRVPPEAILVEQIIGLLDRERIGGGEALDATAMEGELARMPDLAALPDRPALTDAVLDAIRRRVDELHDRWAALPEGETMELEFFPGHP